MQSHSERVPKGRSDPLSCFMNAWDLEFFEHHDCTGKDDVPAVEFKKKIGGMKNELRTFLQTFEDLGYPCEAHEVQKYCKGENLKNLEAGVGEAGERRAAWVDDRNSEYLTGSGNARLCDDLMSATGLLRYLRQPRYNHESQPDAERRLIYIANLTPEYILTLAVTAPFHQVPALRDAICKHIAFQSSIRANIPSDGRLTFQLEFHLPFFSLRNPPSNDFSRRTHGKHLREWRDLSFLKGQNTEQEEKENLGIYQAHISFVACGLDEWNWVAYAFVDTNHRKEEDEDDDDDDDDLVGKTTSSKKLKDDPMTGGSDANLPIWKPQEYFLKALEFQVKVVKQEWGQLVSELKFRISEYERAHPFTWSDASRNTRERAEEMKRSFDWTLLTMRLLNELHRTLFETCDEWNRFSAVDMDIAYFSGLDVCPAVSCWSSHDHHAGRSLRSIKESFETLRKLLQKLDSLRDDLKQFSLALQLRLSYEGNEAVEHNGFTSEFTVWVLYPMTLAASIFSMQPSVIPFGLTPVWFGVTVLILIGGMYVIHSIMKRWASWQKVIDVWMKAKLVEEELDNDLERDRNEFITDTLRGDLVGRLVLGTKVILGRGRNTY